MCPSVHVCVNAQSPESNLGLIHEHNLLHLKHTVSLALRSPIRPGYLASKPQRFCLCLDLPSHRVSSCPFFNVSAVDQI